MLLVGRPTDPHRETASFHDRAVTVFADTPGSGMYNVHGEYVSAFERDTGITLRWLGNPGTFNNCLAAVMRSPEPAFLLDFASYTQRYADVGLPVYRPLEHQPVYPWSIAWRDEQLTEPVAAVVRGALALSRRKGWTSPPSWTGAGVAAARRSSDRICPALRLGDRRPSAGLNRSVWSGARPA